MSARLLLVGDEEYAVVVRSLAVLRICWRFSDAEQGKVRLGMEFEGAWLSWVVVSSNIAEQTPDWSVYEYVLWPSLGSIGLFDES
jgi:hypothetical protein